MLRIHRPSIRLSAPQEAADPCFLTDYRPPLNPFAEADSPVRGLQPLAPAPAGVEAELARLSALAGVERGRRLHWQRLVDEASAKVSGYSLHDDGSVSLHFAAATALVDWLAASLALDQAEQVLASVDQLVLEVPESSR